MDLESAIESTKFLFQAATEEVLIYDGHFDPKIYGNENVARAIKDAADRGVRIEVVCDDGVQVTNELIRDLIAGGKILLHRKNLDKNPLKGIRSLFSYTYISRTLFSSR